MKQVDREKVVAYAMKYKGWKRADFKKKLGVNFLGAWCTQFQVFVLKSCGLGGKIYTGKLARYCRYFAQYSVNKYGATIHFVNNTWYKKLKHNYKKNCFYDKKYKPRKGDLILFIKPSTKSNFSHIGMVREDCSDALHNVPTIEGNTGTYHNSTSYVMARSRDNGDSKKLIVAYLTLEGKDEDVSGYIVGNTYKLQATMNVRLTPGLNGKKIGTLKKGTKVKCLAVKKVGTRIWIKYSKGWMCAKSSKHTYIK